MPFGESNPPSRRAVLKGAGVLGGAAVLSAAAGPAARAGAAPAGRRRAPGAPVPEPFSVPLTVPPVAKPARERVVDGVRTAYYDWKIREAEAEILPGVKTKVLTYDGAFPGPTIKARTGGAVYVTHTNALSTDTVVHLHGGIVAPEDDGHPHDVIKPGASRTYFYPNKQRGSTMWYHDHTHHMEAELAFRGLAGAYVLEDPAEAALGLPSGEYDVPLLIRDARFDEKGQLVFEMMDIANRQTLLVNGRPQPYMRVAARKYRFRLINGSNLRYFTLRLDKGGDLIQIGSDGGLLPAPVPEATVAFSPGERVDVVVDFSKYPVGTQVVLVNDQADSETTKQVMRFDVSHTAPDRSRVPAELAPAPSLGKPDAEREVTMSYDPEQGMFVMDGKVYDPARVDQEVEFGATETWKVVNKDAAPPVPHNVHLHGVHFQVLERDGQPVSGHEAGWKDTVSIPPNGGHVTLKARFDHHRGLYLYHCHLLDHASMGMMAQMKIG